MSACEQFQARIADLRELDPGDRIDLEHHAATCRSCGAKLAEFRRLMADLQSLSAPLHVTGERLTRYAIHRAAPTEPDYDQVRLSAAEIQQIEGHVSQCPRCRLAVDSIEEQYSEMHDLLAEAGVPPLPIDAPSWWIFARRGPARAWCRAKNVFFLIPRYRTAGVALGSLLLLVSLWTGPWFRDPYDRLAIVEPTETTFLTRDSAGEITRGISLMNDGRYSDAIPLLERFATGDADLRLRNYAHYLAGLAWVSEARTEVFGRVLARNASRLDRAIEHLEMVTASEENGRILEDAYWLLGKAHLMKRDAERAVAAFTEVERLDGRRSSEARQLIRAIEELPES